MITFELENNLCLKPMQEVNVEDLFSFIDLNRKHLRKFLSWVDSIKSVDDEQCFIDSLKADDSSLAFVILYKRNIIGSVGFICIDKLNRNAQVGYCIGEKFQGKGIVTKACKHIIKHGFDYLNLERIEFRIAKHNLKSKAIMHRISACFEGTLRKALFLDNNYIDCEIYSLLKGELRGY